MERGQQEQVQEQEQVSPLQLVSGSFDRLSELVQTLSAAVTQAAGRSAEVERLQQQVDQAESRSTAAAAEVSTARSDAVVACGEMISALEGFRETLRA